MNKWYSVGEAFRKIGDGLRIACKNLRHTCEHHEEFEELYSEYCLVLSTLTAQVRFLSMRFDQLRYEQENDQGE